MQADRSLIHATDSAATVGRTDKDFTDGVCSGYLTYYAEYQGKPITYLDVYAFIIHNIADARGTNIFNAGYCTGWIEALIEDRKV